MKRWCSRLIWIKTDCAMRRHVNVNELACGFLLYSRTGLRLPSRGGFFPESILNQFYFWDRISRAFYYAHRTILCAKAVLSGTQFFFGLKKNEKSASGRRKKNILKIKFSKKKLRKIFFSTSLTTFLRWTMAENARGAQYQPCRDVTCLDFDHILTHISMQICMVKWP